MRPRYPELDWLRTAAIIGMVLYHGAYDLDALYGWDLRVDEGLWKLLQRCTATLFLLLVGMSAALPSRTTPLQRFLRIGICALLVSAVTYAADSGTFVYFGVLHLIAVSALLTPLLRPLREGAVVPGIILIFLGLIDALSAAPFPSVDYFPPVPWLGAIFIGYAAGHALYVRGLRGQPETTHPRWRLLGWPGRHALAVYLLHQPLILAVLWLTLGRPAF